MKKEDKELLVYIGMNLLCLIIKYSLLGGFILGVAYLIKHFI